MFEIGNWLKKILSRGCKKESIQRPKKKSLRSEIMYQIVGQLLASLSLEKRTENTLTASSYQEI